MSGMKSAWIQLSKEAPTSENALFMTSWLMDQKWSFAWVSVSKFYSEEDADKVTYSILI